jgi:hypothetical protein
MYVVEHSSDAVKYAIRTRFPFDSMNIGDHFYIDDYQKAQSARVAAIQFVRRYSLDWKFSVRKMDSGWRLFRVN